jgi:cyclomaltodextrinase
MWAYESVFYQIYPLGFTGAPFENDGVMAHRILDVIKWIPHLQKLGVGAVYFGPVFESDTHGYNTRDYRKIDVRLGTNEDFATVVRDLHNAGIKVVIDGVFNHVGRGFFGFQDVLRNREASPYRDWFHIDFGGNSANNDGLWYEGWEGNYDLVRLNLRNPAVTDYLMGCVKQWIDEFDIDGLRLDVAYLLDRDFIRRLRRETAEWKDDFFLVGEMIGGDYNQIMGDDLCHSVTNYECYKGLYSSFNSMNLFEIMHSLLRQYGPEPWTLYRGRHLLNFADNHDVTRFASILQNPKHLKPAYTLLFGMPGIPILYYGSEWGTKADKSEGDPALRPHFEKPVWNDLTDHIAGLSHAFSGERALQYGDIRQLLLTNRQLIFDRTDPETQSRVLVAINADDKEFHAHFDARAGRARDLVTGETVDFGGGLVMPPYANWILKPF